MNFKRAVAVCVYCAVRWSLHIEASMRWDFFQAYQSTAICGVSFLSLLFPIYLFGPAQLLFVSVAALYEYVPRSAHFTKKNEKD